MEDKPHYANGLAKMNANKPGIATTKRTEVIEAIKSGRMVTEVAKDLGVDHSAISHALAQDPEYQTARECGFESRLDKYEDMMLQASDGLTLSRGRELHRAVAWRSERECSRRWGKEAMAVNINANGPMQVQIVSFADQSPPPIDQTSE